MWDIENRAESANFANHGITSRFAALSAGEEPLSTAV